MFLTGNNEYRATGCSLIQPSFRWHKGQTKQAEIQVFLVCIGTVLTGPAQRSYEYRNELGDGRTEFTQIFSQYLLPVKLQLRIVKNRVTKVIN